MPNYRHSGHRTTHFSGSYKVSIGVSPAHLMADISCKSDQSCRTSPTPKHSTIESAIGFLQGYHWKPSCRGWVTVLNPASLASSKNAGNLSLVLPVHRYAIFPLKLICIPGYMLTCITTRGVHSVGSRGEFDTQRLCNEWSAMSLFCDVQKDTNTPLLAS